MVELKGKKTVAHYTAQIKNIKTPVLVIVNILKKVIGGEKIIIQDDENETEISDIKLKLSPPSNEAKSYRQALFIYFPVSFTGYNMD